MVGSVNDWKADVFEYQVDDVIAQGIKDATVFIETYGGDAIAGNRIANIVKKFPGEIKCFLGVVCCSAGTYIACHFKYVEGPGNLQYMIHKPSAQIDGNEDEIKSSLKLVSNITKDYKKVYVAKTAMKEADIEALWVTDYWMDAKEAKDKGFIDAIGPDAEITADTAVRIAASGAPGAEMLKQVQHDAPTNTREKQNEDMKNLPLILAALNLGEGVDESLVLAEVKKIAKENSDLKAQVTALTKEKEDQFAAQVTALVDGAVKPGKITEAERDRYTKLATATYTETAEILAERKAHVPFTSQLKNADGTVLSSAEKAAKFDKLWKESPEVLAEMKTKEPDVYADLEAAWKLKGK